MTILPFRDLRFSFKKKKIDIFPFLYINVSTTTLWSPGPVQLRRRPIMAPPLPGDPPSHVEPPTAAGDLPGHRAAGSAEHQEREVPGRHPIFTTDRKP